MNMDKGHVLGGSGVNPCSNHRSADPSTTRQKESVEQVADLMRGLRGAGFQVYITNTEVGRTDSVEIPTRSWSVASLQKAYRESILIKKLSKLNARWFDYSDIVLSFNGVNLEDEFNLYRYGIRPGSTLLATCTPKVKITLKNQAGQKKPYKVEAYFDWTLQQVKEEYTRVRFKIAPHDWKAEDIVLMDRDDRLIDDSKNVRDFASKLRDKRGDLFFKCNYRWKGMSYCTRAVINPSEMGNKDSTYGRMTESELNAMWEDDLEEDDKEIGY